VKLRRLVVLGAAALTAAVVASVAALVATAGSSPVVAVPRVPPARPAVSVPRGALVLARQDGTRVLALSVRRDGARVRARVTVLGPDGTGVGGLAVSVSGVRAQPCGRGCYAASLPRASGACGSRRSGHLRARRDSIGPHRLVGRVNDLWRDRCAATRVRRLRRGWWLLSRDGQHGHTEHGR